MDVFTHITQFWLAIVDILLNITKTLIGTTEAIDSITFEDSPFTQYMGYAKTVTGAPLWTMLTSVMMISIGVTVYKTFLKGVALVKSLLIRI